MYKIKRSYSTEEDLRLAEIVPVERIRYSVQLFPQFGPGAVSQEWTWDNVLDECESFYVNPFTNDHVYSLFYNMQ